jgi:acetolactate synthase-1/2/3 large subunit
MAKMTAAQAIARFLKSVGTKRYYLYNGHANWGLLDALEYDVKIKGIRTRHEVHAIHMADIEWRMRRKLPIPVTCTTVGPGNFNTIPGIAEAFYDSTPMFCLMAGGPTKWLGRGGIQEVYRYGEDEFLQIFRPITKHAVMTIRPDTALQSAMRAYKVAITGRPGPVVVYMPLDVQNTEIDIEMPDFAAWLTNIHGPGPDSGAIAKAAQLIARAKRPFMWVGTGVNNAHAWDELRAFAETTQIPVGTNFGAKGALPEDHKLSLGVVDRSGTGHGVKAAVEADVVINIGARFNDLNTAGWSFYNFGKGQKLVHIDIDPGEIGRVYPVDIGIVSDAGKALVAFNQEWRRKKLARPATGPWLKAIAGWRRDWLKEAKPLVESNIAPLHYARIVKDASDVVNEIAPQTSVICDTGFIMNFLPAFYTLKHPWFATNNQQFGQMGFAPPGVVGARLERPQHPVLVWVGDQSFIHTGLSLATATEYGVAGVVIVLNNKTIQAEVEGAKAKFGRGVGDHYRIEKTDEPWNPDLGLIGEALRARVFKVARPSELKPALAAALKSGKLCILDVDASTVVPRYAVPIVLKHGTMPFPYDWNMNK